ncbi:MAG TPA: hypothetical protein VK486_04615 [Thermoleophilaceae bacterium]|nr:hypothetical protein [Thermoleophilaceae bacterium]
MLPAGAAFACDPLDPSACLYPWPNDQFTTADASSPTGRRLALRDDWMPRNRLGKPISAAPYNSSDGFSPGNMIVTKVPGLDTPAAFAQTGAVPITDIERSFDPDQPIVVINARTLERQLIWSELDANPADPRDVTLIIRPSVNFDEGERYIVALRNLKDARGHKIKAGAAFRALRDGKRDPQVEARRPHFEQLFQTLTDAGIDRKDLYLAWDFTVASREGLSGRALHIRNQAFAELGDNNLSDLVPEGAEPAFVPNPDLPDNVPDEAEADGRRDLGDSIRISGNVRVPCFLNAPNCPPGSEFALGPDGLPQRIPGNTTLANVVCVIPKSAPAGALRPSLYGHGLLGAAGEVTGANVRAMANEHGFVFCATDWTGMSTLDVPNVLGLLQDLSRFPTLADRAQQGFVNFMYVGRWMLKRDWGDLDVDQSRLFYDGNSQGGIMGGALTALAPDFDRAVLGVPGMNYSTLLRRSVDFDLYAHGNIEGTDTPLGLYDSYPNELERPLILSLIQLLWDRAEANGYAHHITDDPLPGTPAHTVLMHVAFADHQVANVTAEVEARTIGASVRWPALAPGRHTDVNPYFGIPHLDAFPFGGSAMVLWDTGIPPAPTTNTPPREGQDPHSAPRNSPKARRQKSEFLRVGGSVIDVCDGAPCTP